MRAGCWPSGREDLRHEVIQKLCQTVVVERRLERFPSTLTHQALAQEPEK
jgi:hypothetical protein